MTKGEAMRFLRIPLVLVIVSSLLLLSSAPIALAFNASIAVTITASPTSVNPGDLVTWTVTETNDGDVVLTNPWVGLSGAITATLDKASASFKGGDSNADGNLDPGETWQWAIFFNPSADATITATGHATDPAGNEVTYPGDPNARASATVTVSSTSGTTTIEAWVGYWKTHPDAWAATGYAYGDLVKSVFTSAANYSPLGDASLIEALKFNGGDGAQGAAAILLRTAVAALLNAASPDIGYSLTTAEVIAKVNAALDSRDRTTILKLAGQLAG